MTLEYFYGKPHILHVSIIKHNTMIYKEKNVDNERINLIIAT